MHCGIVRHPIGSQYGTDSFDWPPRPLVTSLMNATRVRTPYSSCWETSVLLKRIRPFNFPWWRGLPMQLGEGDRRPTNEFATDARDRDECILYYIHIFTSGIRGIVTCRTNVDWQGAVKYICVTIPIIIYCTYNIKSTGYSPYYVLQYCFSWTFLIFFSCSYIEKNFPV